MKTKESKTGKKVNVESKAATSKPNPKANYKNLLAKALGKPASEVQPVEVPEDKPERTLVQPAYRSTRNPFAGAIKDKNVAETISAEVKKSKAAMKDAEDTLPDGTPIETVEVVGGKVVKHTSVTSTKPVVRTSPKEMARLQGEKEEIAEAKKEMQSKTKSSGVSALLSKSVKETTPAAKETGKPTSKPKAEGKKEHKPFSKMTLDELIAIKGTSVISDAQWIKYARPLGYKAEGVAEKKVAPAAKVEDTPAPKIARKSSFERVTEVHKAKEASKLAAEVKPENVKAAVKIVKANLSEYTLDELIAELKRRGCKGSIRVCVETEL